jgi:hypothetical protein
MHHMRVAGLMVVLLPPTFGGCTFSSSDPPAPRANTTIVRAARLDRDLLERRSASMPIGGVPIAVA